SGRYRSSRSFCFELSGNFLPGGDYGAAAKKSVQTRIPQLKAKHRTRRKPSVDERNRPVPLSAVAGIGARAVSSSVANDVPSNKENFETLRFYAFAAPGSCLAQHKSYN